MNAVQGRVPSRLPIRLLGQSGCRLGFPGCTVYLDPYLSNAVQELDAADLARLLPIPFAPQTVTDADWVLLTHEHIDHCDPHTLPALADASPGARFMGPAPVIALLSKWGIAADRLQLASEGWTDLAPDVRIHAVPAAHPRIERDASGNLRHVGYVIARGEGRLYLAGDTSVVQELIDSLGRLGPISTAFLPVNEHNFYRGRRGIIGNMSIREAFQLAAELGVENLVPVHWDMFAANAASVDEIQAVYAQMAPRFRLLLRPDHVVV
jgi:L-ascorbate metabolism protein UlaG (beta-lactamase superfamily)